MLDANFLRNIENEQQLSTEWIFMTNYWNVIFKLIFNFYTGYKILLNGAQGQGRIILKCEMNFD
jgi:hypothetical protein